MSRHSLLSTPEGLESLQEKLAPIMVGWKVGFISTELMFSDAQSAHELHQLLQELYQAASRVQRRAKAVDAKSSPKVVRDLATLRGVLLRARHWM